MKKPVQLLLDPEQGEILSDYGQECFLVIHRLARTEQPDVNRRFVLSIHPCTVSQANAAALVASGTHTATLIRKARTSERGATTAMPASKAQTPGGADMYLLLDKTAHRPPSAILIRAKLSIFEPLAYQTNERIQTTPPKNSAHR